MRSLLFKEWIVNQSIIILILNLIVLASLFVELTGDSGRNPIFLAFVLGCLYPFVGDMSENTNKSENLINSLPVSRNEIVASKYVGSLLIGKLFNSPF